MAHSDSTRAPRGATTRRQRGDAAAFDIERDLIHPASEIVGNLRDALAAIGDGADTSAAAAEINRLRDLLDDADIAAIRARKDNIDQIDKATLKLDGAAALATMFGIFAGEVKKMPINGELLNSAMYGGISQLIESACDDLNGVAA